MDRSLVSRSTLTAALCLMASACANLDLMDFRDNLGPIREVRLPECEAPVFGAPVPVARPSAAEVLRVTPDRLAETDVMRDVASLFHVVGAPADGGGVFAAPMDGDGQVAPTEIGQTSLLAVKEFGERFGETMLNPHLYLQKEDFYAEAEPILAMRTEYTLVDVFRTYYTAYVDGTFVDRFGKKLARPEITNVIGNESISGALLVFLEALADFQLKTPLLYNEVDEKKQYVFSNGQVPVAVQLVDAGVLREVRLLQENESQRCGITPREAKAIKYLASLAADRSAMVSGLTAETIGDVQIALIVGGHFSLGDNETLATLVKTLFEAVSRRGTEAMAFGYFDKFAYRPRPDAFGLGDGSGEGGGVEEFVLSFSGVAPE